VDGLQKLRGVGSIKLRQKFNLRLGAQVFHRFPGNLPGLAGSDRGRNQHYIGKRWVTADPAADLRGIGAAAFIQSAVPIAAARRVVLGLGVAQQHQTAHGDLDSFRVFAD
jgi:hypothetical protein